MIARKLFTLCQRPLKPKGNKIQQQRQRSLVDNRGEIRISTCCCRDKWFAEAALLSLAPERTRSWRVDRPECVDATTTPAEPKSPKVATFNIALMSVVVQIFGPLDIRLVPVLSCWVNVNLNYFRDIRRSLLTPAIPDMIEIG